MKHFFINFFREENQKDLKPDFKFKFKEYIFVSILLIILTIAFLWRIFFLGDVLLPGDLVNTRVHPWMLSEENAYTPGEKPHNPELSDPIYIYYPMKHYLKDCFDEGITPLWNPLAFSGYPYISRVVSEMYNPLDFLFLLLPTARAFGYSVALRLFLAGLFMYAFARTLSIKKIGAFFAAVVFMFNANTILWLEFPTHLKGELWMPLIFMLLIKCYQQKKILFSILTGIFLGLQITSGYSQAVQFTVIAIAVLLLVNVIYDITSKNYKDAGFKIGSTILSGFIGLIIGLCFIIPFYSEYINSYRVILPRGVAGNYNFRYLLTFLNPNFFANNIYGRFWLRGTNFTEGVNYSGIATLFLAFIAAIFKRTKIVISFVVIAIVTTLIASAPPVYIFFNNIIPFFDASAISRVLVLVPFSLAILSGYGLSHLISIVDRNKTKFKGILKSYNFKILISIVLLGVVFISLILFFINHFGAHIDINRVKDSSLHRLETLSFIFFIILTVISIAIIALSLFVPKGRRTILLFTVPLLILDLFIFGININTTSKKDQIYFETPSIEQVRQDKDIYRVLGMGGGTFNPNSAWIFNFQEIGGYDPIIPLDYANFWIAFHGMRGIRPNGKVGADNLYDNFLKLTNTKYIFSHVFIDSRGYFVDNTDKMVNKDAYEDIEVTNWNFMTYLVPTIEVPPDSKMEFDYFIGESKELVFYNAIHPGVWHEDTGNGVIYKIYIEYNDRKDLVYEKDINPIQNEEHRRWFFERIDLSEYGGKKVRVIFETLSKDCTLNDRPGWGNPKILTKGTFGIVDMVLQYNKEIKVYRNEVYLPRAFLVNQSKYYRSSSEVLEAIVNDRDIDLRRVVLFENEKISSDNRNELSKLNNPIDKNPGKVEILEYENNYIKLEVNAAQDCYLVLLDRYDKDWNVYIDGNPDKIYNANYSFRAVNIAKGEHIVEFRYEPIWFIYTLIISLSTLVICIVLSIFLWRIKSKKTL